MADNIQNILAALAAQNGQQAQPPPGVPGASYQPPPQYSTPPGGATPYGLPQPINSGSLDIAGIKPINSGSMSFGDPGRESYDPARVPSRSNDPRMAGRGYRRSRSPSRSPPRMRDDFRDSYNPYRDERRGGAERGYTRERSLSPARAGRFSPPGYRDQRSPPRVSGGTDGDAEVMPIEKSQVGMIIGRGGETLRRVENTTGARVQFMDGPETTSAQRHCKISGSRAARAAAKAELYRIIDENEGTKRGAPSQAPPRGLPRLTQGAPQGLPQGVTMGPRDGDSLQMLVPDRTVGLIIGRGGETIRDLQERSGCHVNIVGENKSINGMRPVNLIGSISSQDFAKSLIMEIVESDQKGISIKELRSRNREESSSSGDKINDSIMVPGDSVGMIIGKGGETIKDMQNQTGCKINVSPASGRDVEREIGLIGTRQAIEAAKRVILSKVDAVDARNRSQGRDTHDDYASSYAPQQQQPGYPPAGMPATQQPGAQPRQGAGGADPYAAYGGYQNYLQMWYQAMAQQQGGQPPQ